MVDWWEGLVKLVVMMAVMMGCSAPSSSLERYVLLEVGAGEGVLVSRMRARKRELGEGPALVDLPLFVWHTSNALRLPLIISTMVCASRLGVICAETRQREARDA